MSDIGKIIYVKCAKDIASSNIVVFRDHVTSLARFILCPNPQRRS